MPAQDRRSARRFIMKVPCGFADERNFRPRRDCASMNISTHGVFFATEQKVSEGLLLQVHLKMPRRLPEMTWKSGVSPLASRTSNHWAQQAKFPGVGVQFLYTRSPPPRFRDISFRAAQSSRSRLLGIRSQGTSPRGI